MHKTFRCLAALTASVAVGLAAAEMARPAPTTERVSVSSTEAPGLGHSGFVSGFDGEPVAVSADGRFVAFTSNAANLVPRDRNGACDAFVRDRLLGETERVSVSSSGRQGNLSSCFGIALSGEGRFVAFASRASNFARHDTNDAVDVFLRDRARGRTHRISRRFDGHQIAAGATDPAISADGSLIAFSSTGHVVRRDTGIEDVYVYRRNERTTRRISVTTAGRPGNADSFDPDVSADGAVVAFASRASNLARPDQNFDGGDVFVRVLATDRTRRVSIDSNGDQLLDCSSGGSFSPKLDEHGVRVVFTEVDPGCLFSHVMLRDRAAHTTEQLDQGMGSTAPNGASSAQGISADASTVVFSSSSSNLVPGDTNGGSGSDPFDFSGTDVFVVDVATGATDRVSLSDSDAQVTGSTSFLAAMSADGAFVSFISRAKGVVSGDTNRKTDVFLRGPL